jgi:phytoene/squalene synthetase
MCRVLSFLVGLDLLCRSARERAMGGYTVVRHIARAVEKR